MNLSHNRITDVGARTLAMKIAYRPVNTEIIRLSDSSWTFVFRHFGASTSLLTASGRLVYLHWRKNFATTRFVPLVDCLSDWLSSSPSHAQVLESIRMSQNAVPDNFSNTIHTLNKHYLVSNTQNIAHVPLTPSRPTNQSTWHRHVCNPNSWMKCSEPLNTTL